MDESIKFNPKKLEKLNNPERFKTLNPDLIWEGFNVLNPNIIIDIGAGSGFFTKEFSKRTKGGKIYACDSSDVMINWMQKNITDKNIVPLLCLESFINLPDETADLVYMINVHHEILNHEKLLMEVYRLLKAGGKIAIIDWKAEEMLDGPALKIRIPDKIVIEQLKMLGFGNIVSHEILPSHYFIVAQK